MAVGRHRGADERPRPINFVDRLKRACSRPGDRGANGLFIEVGWASPAPGGNLGDALSVAEARLAEATRNGP